MTYATKSLIKQLDYFFNQSSDYFYRVTPTTLCVWSLLHLQPTFLLLHCLLQLLTFLPDSLLHGALGRTNGSQHGHGEPSLSPPHRPITEEKTCCKKWGATKLYTQASQNGLFNGGWLVGWLDISVLTWISRINSGDHWAVGTVHKVISLRHQGLLHHLPPRDKHRFVPPQTNAEHIPINVCKLRMRKWRISVLFFVCAMWLWQKRWLIHLFWRLVVVCNVFPLKTWYWLWNNNVVLTLFVWN